MEFLLKFRFRFRSLGFRDSLNSEVALPKASHHSDKALQ